MIMKKTRSRKHFLSRSLLWAHVIGVVGFYLVLWQRTAPNKKDCVKPLPTEDGVVSSSRSAAPTVSIIVPARDEESNIGRCVTSLLEQDYEHYEIIVVDDGSTDATGRILDELTRTHPNRDRLWVLRLRDLPTGWAGKPHALHCGVQEARGEWLLFTDADTWHAPHCLRSAMAQALQEKADLFTMGAEQELPSFWDKVLMPMAYLSISMQYPPKKVNDPNSSVAIANGQYILIRRQVYDQIYGVRCLMIAIWHESSKRTASDCALWTDVTCCASTCIMDYAIRGAAGAKMPTWAVVVACHLSCCH
jgi:chlorobactene glucosyltransferase